MLVRGPELVRTATAGPGATLALTGDTTTTTDLEVWAPASVHHVTWNGDTVPVTATGSGQSLRRARTGRPAAGQPARPVGRDVAKRARVTRGAADFDDSTWPSADKTVTNSTTKPPAGQPVLTADDYGFHQGDVWYRGRSVT